MPPLECPPVLLLVCDRPDLTRRVLDRIREARPRQLYVAADGPRLDGAEGARLCEEARAAALDVDWDCDVETLLRERNLGCKHAVGSAITWFFERVEEGIVLEDDCVADPTFFGFCAELLERYRKDKRVVAIGGNNFREAPPGRNETYTFSAYPQIWGWATWRRAWAHYDGTLSRWPELRETGWLEGFLGDRTAARFWRAVFDRDLQGQIDTWDFAWTLACWAQDGLTVHPSINLVSNVGFDDRATHTRNPASPLADVRADRIDVALVHPPAVARDYEADRFTAEHVHRVSLRTSRRRRALQRLRQTRLSRLPGGGYPLRRRSRADS
jgi:hypothetical protein